MIATASRRLVLAALIAALALGGCVAQPPPAPSAPPADPTVTDLELLALEHHAAYGDAMVGTVDVAMIGLESTALLEELATPEVAALDASSLLAVLDDGQRLVAPATATSATVLAVELPDFRIALCIDTSTVRYEDRSGNPVDSNATGPDAMLMAYELRDRRLPIATFQTAPDWLDPECPG